jgi:hypothetical protein
MGAVWRMVFVQERISFLAPTNVHLFTNLAEPLFQINETLLAHQPCDVCQILFRVHTTSDRRRHSPDT